jgi:hypothetical protein
VVRQVHLVQSLEGEAAPEASIQKRAGWEDAAQLIELLIDRAFEHQLAGLTRRVSVSGRQPLRQVPVHELHVEFPCLKTRIG